MSNYKIVSYTIEGIPKWRNWTDEGEYDYIYPVKDAENNIVYIREKRILKKKQGEEAPSVLGLR